MELELGLALPSPHLMINEEFSFKIVSTKKRGFEEAFEIKTTLPLFPAKAGSDCDVEKVSLVVGWPPVKASRRRSGGDGYGDGECRRRRANCVKVSMEGVVIGRKVDLSLHNSYEELFSTLNQMFNWKQSIDHDENGADHQAFTVTYEDGDGDWLLLVGDVPWKEFIQSAKRLKILN